MTVERELISAIIAIGTGLIVTLIVYAVGDIGKTTQRRTALRNIRSVVRAFEDQLRSATNLQSVELPSGSTEPLEDAARFAFWNEYLDKMRLIIAANSPYLKQRHFIEIMDLIDGQEILYRMIDKEGKYIMGTKVYERYLEELRGLIWLKL